MSLRQTSIELLNWEHAVRAAKVHSGKRSSIYQTWVDISQIQNATDRRTAIARGICAVVTNDCGSKKTYRCRDRQSFLSMDDWELIGYDFFMELLEENDGARLKSEVQQLNNLFGMTVFSDELASVRKFLFPHVKFEDLLNDLYELEDGEDFWTVRDSFYEPTQIPNTQCHATTSVSLDEDIDLQKYLQNFFDKTAECEERIALLVEEYRTDPDPLVTSIKQGLKDFISMMKTKFLYGDHTMTEEEADQPLPTQQEPDPVGVNLGGSSRSTSTAEDEDDDG